MHNPRFTEIIDAAGHDCDKLKVLLAPMSRVEVFDFWNDLGK